MARTLEDRLLAAGNEVGGSLRSARGRPWGLGPGPGATVTPVPLRPGVAWPAGTEFRSGVAAAGGDTGGSGWWSHWWGCSEQWQGFGDSVRMAVTVVTEGSMSSTVAVVSAGSLRGGQEVEEIDR